MEVTEKELNCSGIRVHEGAEESRARREVCKVALALFDGSGEEEKQVRELRLGPTLTDNSRSPRTIFHVYYLEMEIGTQTGLRKEGEREIPSSRVARAKAYFRVLGFSLSVEKPFPSVLSRFAGSLLSSGFLN